MTEQQLAPMTLETFTPHLGRVFDVQNIDLQVELTLLEVEDTAKGRPWPPSLPRPFTLIFSGPAKRVLIEGMRVIAAADGTAFELYFIPIVTPDPASGQHYQVVFN